MFKELIGLGFIVAVFLVFVVFAATGITKTLLDPDPALPCLDMVNVSQFINGTNSTVVLPIYSPPPKTTQNPKSQPGYTFQPVSTFTPKPPPTPPPTTTPLLPSGGA